MLQGTSMGIAALLAFTLAVLGSCGVFAARLVKRERAAGMSGAESPRVTHSTVAAISGEVGR